MEKALKANAIQESFTFTDLRSRAAIKAEELAGREYARDLLAHKTQKTTARYIRKIKAVKPLT